jgi:UDP-glucose 4-epimerase
MREDMVPQPEDPYGVAKYAVELDLRAAHEMFGLKWVIFRPHNVYGENQNIGDRYRNVIGIFMNQIMQGKPMTVFGDGEQTRAFSHIDDVAPQIAASVTVPESFGEVINIGADEPYTVNRLADVVAGAFGVTANVEHFPARNEVVHAYSDHAKARRLFGNTPPVTLEDGITRMAAWARRVGARESKPFRDIEIRRNLPSKWA